MVTILSGVGLLLVTLAVFSIFSLKMPKGSLAMGGMADAAVATFLVEAIHKYISGDLIGIAFLREVGDISGSMGGVAAATLVPIAMGANPLFAVVAGVAVGGFGILPGFIAGYVIGFIAPIIEKKLPVGINIIAGALVIAPVARIIVTVVDPGVTWILSHIGATISAATDQSPIVMGFPVRWNDEDDPDDIAASSMAAHSYVRTERSSNGYCSHRMFWWILYKWTCIPQTETW